MRAPLRTPAALLWWCAALAASATGCSTNPSDSATPSGLTASSPSTSGPALDTTPITSQAAPSTSLTPVAQTTSSGPASAPNTDGVSSEPEAPRSTSGTLTHEPAATSESSETNASTSSETADDAGAVPQVVLDVAEVWSGHPVNFGLATTSSRQYAAYFAANQSLTVASRELTSDTWSYRELDTKVGWDSHNHIALAVDEQGYVHVSGNMHNVPLIYYRSSSPGDISSLQRVTSMVGPNEQSVTYPEFFRTPSGALAFAYRDGGSGNGNHIFNAYDVGSKSWRRLLDTPLTDGEGQRNAYPVGPVQGPDDFWHLVWVWRDTPDADTNHDLSYARTKDLVHWETGATGEPLVLPVRLDTGDIVDAVPTNAGLINNNTKVGFDAQNRPVVVYHKYDSRGNTQLFNARVENGRWVAHQTSNWDYRWDFGGQGTLVFEIEVEGVRVQPDGRLTQVFYHAQYGGWGAFELDPETLAAIREIDPPLPYPAELDAPLSQTPGMKVRWASDWSDGESDYTYRLRWETLDSNRDMPRSPVPASTPLKLYGFPK